MTTVELKKFATEIRIETVKAIAHMGQGHMGGSLSIADCLAVLYSGEMRNIDPKNPQNPDRDLLVMAKGHCGPALFSALALKGFFPLSELMTLCQGGSRLPSHCDRLRTPGIDASTGSLGQGLSVANGYAYGAKLNKKDTRVYCIMGDGEIQEGQIWEAAIWANQYKLNNLIGIVDWNKKQIDGPLEQYMDMIDIAKKFEAFGWYAITVKGDDVEALQAAFENVRANQGDRPACIVLDTIKGGGVKYISDMYYNHCIPVSADMESKCLEQLNETMAELTKEEQNNG